jgi:hypothetical protein
MGKVEKRMKLKYHYESLLQNIRLTRKHGQIVPKIETQWIQGTYRGLEGFSRSCKVSGGAFFFFYF